MTEQEWAASAEPASMLDYLREEYGDGWPDGWERRLRLFACASVRLGWGELTDCRSRSAVEASELYADSLADNAYLGQHRNSACDARDAARNESGRMWASRAHAVTSSNEAALALNAARWGYPSLQAQADLLRDIASPFRPVTLPEGQRYCDNCDGAGSCWEYYSPFGSDDYDRTECCRCDGRGWFADGPCPWLTPTVLSLAQAAYDERQPDGTLDPLRLAVLADALEEVGCETHDGVCLECNGSGELGTLGGKIGCYVCAPDYKTRGTGRSNRRLLRCQCGGGYVIVRKKSFPVPISSCLRCRADGPPWADVIRGEVLPHPILAHLRSPGSHWRGCHVVDLILGKE